MKKVLLTFVLLFVLVCAPAFAGENQVLVKIGNKKITVTDMNRLLGYYDAEKQKALEANPNLKVNFLRNYTESLIISEKAKSEGLDKLDNVKEQIEMLVNDFLKTEYLRAKADEILKSSPVQEEELKSYYKAHKEDFGMPEEVRARHILVLVDKAASAADKKKARGKIEDIMSKIKAGEDFVKLASEYSEDSGSKAKGGALGYFKRGKMVPEFEKAAFALKPGEVSDIVETKYGFHIIKAEAKKDALFEPFERVQGKIKEKIFSERKDALHADMLDKAMKAAGVEVTLEPLLQKK